MNFLLTRSSRDLPRDSWRQHPFLLSSPCLTASFSYHDFLSLSQPAEEPSHPAALSSDLSRIAPAVSRAPFTGFTAPSFPSYSNPRARSHLPRFIAKQRALTLPWAFMHYAFAKGYTATAGHSTTRQEGQTQDFLTYTSNEQSSQILLEGEKSPENFKMQTEVICLVLRSPNLDSFRLPETWVSEAHRLLRWQSRAVSCRENNHRNPADHNSHDRAWSGGGREKQFSQLTLSQAFKGLIRS